VTAYYSGSTILLPWAAWFSERIHAAFVVEIPIRILLRIEQEAKLLLDTSYRLPAPDGSIYGIAVGSAFGLNDWMHALIKP